ncbi:MAG: endonuclease/exonuclease/phosphatase family protein [Bdellovibrionales bacterium]|nr:endonuclease/exonuclease/phosphatase family protein [Bdellovibrionales bacterium]
MKSSKILILAAGLVCSVAIVWGCTSTSKPNKNKTGGSKQTQAYKGLEYSNSWSSSGDSVVFMTFNVENLFDVQDEPGKNDATFLPLKLKQTAKHKKTCSKIKNKRWRDQCLNWDWSQKVFDFKRKALSKSILQANAGKGPDILVLQEVENIRALNALNETDLNYPTVVLIEGHDKRGIDVALLSRFPQRGEAKLHKIPFEGFGKKRVGDTRGVLQVDLKLPGGEIVTVLGVHFPAPFHPAKMRQQAYKKLNEIKKALPKQRLVLAAGDFNVPKREDKKMNLVLKAAGDDWVIGHKVACATCPGSTYYPPKDSWSFLDMILWSAGEGSSWSVLPESMRILNQGPGQVADSGAPARFEIEGPSGVSDHWPLAIDLKRKPEATQ